VFLQNFPKLLSREIEFVADGVLPQERRHRFFSLFVCGKNYFYKKNGGIF